MDRIVVYKAADGWRWKREASGNYREIAESGEAYEAKADAEEAAARQAVGEDVEIVVEEPE